MNSFDIKEGQTYVCTKSERPWWTVGREYSVVLNTSNKPVLVDDEGDNWSSNDLNGPNSYFILKDEQPKTLERTYTSFDVNKVILRAHNMYGNDAQRLAFIKGYFAK